MTTKRPLPPPIPRRALGHDAPAPSPDGDPDLGDATELTTGDQTELTQADATEHNFRPSTTAIHRPSFGDMTEVTRRRDVPDAHPDATLDEAAPEATLDEDPDGPFADLDDDE